MSHPRLNLGFSVHSTWLNELSTGPSGYDVRSDYAPLVDRLLEEIPSRELRSQITNLFEEMYKRFNQQG